MAKIRCWCHGITPLRCVGCRYFLPQPGSLRNFREETFHAHETGSSLGNDRLDDSRDGESAVHIYALDGAVHDVSMSETAFAYRDVKFVHIIAAGTPDPASMLGMFRSWVSTSERRARFIPPKRPAISPRHSGQFSA